MRLSLSIAVRALFGASALIIAAMATAAPPLSEPERKLVAFIDAHNSEAEALLDRTVNVNSETMNFDGVREVGRIFRAKLDSLGFATRWIDGEPFHRAGHLVGEHRGSHLNAKAPRLLLIGHLDTVFEKDSSFQRFERLPGGKARGPGVIDMKGGDVVMLLALQALRAAGALEKLSVTVVMTGDEEKAGDPLALARQPLIEAAGRCDIAIGFEDGAGRPEEAVVARRGSSDWVLRVTGTPAHSSQIFRDDVGSGAIFEAARILDEFQKKLAGEKYLTFNPGVVVGGTTAELDKSQNRGAAFGKSNVVAGQAAAEGDLRTVSPEQLQNAKARMREIVAAHLPGTDASIEFDDGYPPMAPTEGNRKLLSLYDRASRDLGLGPVVATDPMKAGAADVAFAMGHVAMALDGIGLMGSDDHTDRETADLATLPSQAKRVAVLMLRLTPRSSRASWRSTK